MTDCRAIEKATVAFLCRLPTVRGDPFALRVPVDFDIPEEMKTCFNGTKYLITGYQLRDILIRRQKHEQT